MILYPGHSLWLICPVCGEDLLWTLPRTETLSALFNVYYHFSILLLMHAQCSIQYPCFLLVHRDLISIYLRLNEVEHKGTLRKHQDYTIVFEYSEALVINSAYNTSH